MQSPEPCPIQHQAVPLLEQGVAAAGLPPLVVLCLSRHIYNVTASPLPEGYECNHPEMIAGRAPPPAILEGDMKY